jgi:hypothetical protein
MLTKTQTLSPELPVTGIKKFKQVIGGLMIMALIGYGIISGLIWLFTPSDPATIKDISRQIISANEVTQDGKKLLKIELNAKGYNDYSYFFDATKEANDILGKLMEYFPNQASEQINFVLYAELSDKYGNTSSEPVIDLPFAMADVKKINFKNESFNNWSLLKLAKPVIFLHPYGKTIITNYCQDDSSIKYTGMFCPIALLDLK